MTCAVHEAIAAVIRAVPEQFPWHQFNPVGEVDGNHHIARFRWESVSTADGSAPVAGSDATPPAEGGRITSVLGFLDRLPGA